MSSSEASKSSPPPAATRTASPAEDGTEEEQHQQLDSSSPAREARPESSSLTPDGSPTQLPDGFSSQDADADKHPKGKRKRTTSRDKQLLEAAYAANPKPDKAARLDVVSRVSMTEKEVQIWFQNRRQNDRRKARPLSPQEVEAFGYGRMHVIASSDPASYMTPSSAERVDMASNRSDNVSPTAARSTAHHSEDMYESDDREPASRDGRELGAGHGHTGSALRSPHAAAASPAPTSLNTSFSSSVGYLSNRWNPFAFETLLDFTPSSSEESAALRTGGPPSSSMLPNPPSNVRLSLSLEGKAELVSSETSPLRFHPPHDPKAQAPTPLVLSNVHPHQQPGSGGAGLPVLPPISALTSGLPPAPHKTSAGTASAAGPGPAAAVISSSATSSTGRGRSRNVRAWESCCDSSADPAGRDDELTALAECESSGSAVAAISLLRSSSSSGTGVAAHSNGAKRHAAHHRRDHSASSARAASVAPAHHHHNHSHSHPTKRLKLGRSSSSFGRMQSGSDLGNNNGSIASPLPTPPTELATLPVVSREKQLASKPGKLSVAMMISSPGGDSDKENWSPDDDGRPSTSSQHHRGRRAGTPVIVQQQHHANPRRVPERGASVLGPAPAAALNRSNTAPVLLTAGRGQRRGGAAQHQGPMLIFEDGKASVAPPEKAGSKLLSPPRGPAPVLTSTVPLQDQVERFLRGGEISPSKRPDMDCVAGLLSLSQGNWR